MVPVVSLPGPPCTTWSWAGSIVPSPQSTRATNVSAVPPGVSVNPGSQNVANWTWLGTPTSVVRDEIASRHGGTLFTATVFSTDDAVTPCTSMIVSLDV